MTTNPNDPITEVEFQDSGTITIAFVDERRGIIIEDRSDEILIESARDVDHLIAALKAKRELMAP
jgi:hypothetical protein